MSDLNKYHYTYSPSTTYTNSTSQFIDQLKDVMRQLKAIRLKDIADTIVCTHICLEKLKSIFGPHSDRLFGIPVYSYETFERAVIEGLKLRAAGKKVLLVDNAGDVKDLETQVVWSDIDE